MIVPLPPARSALRSMSFRLSWLITFKASGARHREIYQFTLPILLSSTGSAGRRYPTGLFWGPRSALGEGATNPPSHSTGSWRDRSWQARHLQGGQGLFRRQLGGGHETEAPWAICENRAARLHLQADGYPHRIDCSTDQLPEADSGVNYS